MYGLRYAAIVPVALLFVLLMISCSGGQNPLTMKDNNVNSTLLGVFEIIPSEDLQSAEVREVRNAQFDVTKWAKLKILNVEWDPILRNWTLKVEITNPTQFSGWGVQAIFTELGQKELRWPDGFTWLDLKAPIGELERYPFFAVEKATPNRIFEGFHVSTRDVTFHFPEGVDIWAPIKFFLDAHLNGPRPNPMVEDLAVSNFPPPCQHATVSVNIQDHQSPSGDLAVWIDLSPIGGSNAEPMHDDGKHNDGEAGDGIFGVDFTGGEFGQIYTLTVYARDPQSFTGENDIRYSPISYPPLPPIDFETMFIGQVCLIQQERLEVIRDEKAWDQFWSDFSPWDMPPPIIDFNQYQVIAVCIGSRPDTCYKVEIKDISWSSVNCGWSVNYTETIPGPDCACGDMVTTPYHLIKTPASMFDVMFNGGFYEDPCTDTQYAPVPLVNAEPNPQDVCAAVHFTDAGSYDPDGGSLTYEWDWDNDGIYDESGADVYHSWDVPGTYYVNFRVTDDENVSTELDDPLEIKIVNVLPDAVAQVSKINPAVGEEITFDGSLSQDLDCKNQSIAQYEWDFDFNGTFEADAAGSIAKYAYGKAGEFQVQLRVTDNEGDTDMLDKPITIKVGDNPCLDLELLIQGSHGVETEKTMMILYDEASWKTWYEYAVFWGTPPDIDFDKYMAIAVTMGVFNTGGYYATVESACIDLNELLEIQVTWHHPHPTCPVLQVITYPYAVYLCEKVSNLPQWVETLDVYKCD